MTAARAAALRLDLRPSRLLEGMSARALWTFLAVILPALGGIIAEMSTVDLTYHIRAGEQILSGGGIPATDSWTLTATGLPWQDQQWGAQAIFALVWRLGGWTGLVLLRMVLFSLTFGAVFLAIRKAGAAVRPAAVLTLAAFGVATFALGLRPQLLGMTLFAFVLLVLAYRHRSPRAIWAIPIIVIVWANVHGSFFLGPVAVGVAWLEDLAARRPAARRTLLVAVASGVAAIVTPFGPWVYLYAIGLSTNSLITDRITEWQPTSPRTAQGIVFLASALAAAFLLIRRGSTLRWPTLAWLAFLFVLAAYAARGIAWWPVGAAVALAPLLPAGATRFGAGAGAKRPIGAVEPRLARRLNAIIAGLLVATCVVLLPTFRPSNAISGPTGLLKEAPFGVTLTLLSITEPDDRVFNPQPWGSWFEFIDPGAKIFVDSRIELFPLKTWQDYDAITGGAAEWQEILDRYDIRIVVTSADQGPAFTDRLRASPVWEQLFSDRQGAVFVRRP